MRFTTRRVSDGNVFPISNPRPITRRPSGTVEPSPATPSVPRNPALRRLHRFRKTMIPIILMFVFTTIILGAIYAYCVAQPHTAIADQLARDSTAEIDGSIFGRRQDEELTPAVKSPQGGDDESTEPQTALLFYTLTTPGVSLVHLTFELIMHHHTPQHLRKRAAFIVLLTTTSLLTAGWLTTLAFWMHCELPPLNATGQNICPAQVRGHFMYGIHEVSIAKTVVGWLITLVYLGEVVLLVMGWGAMKRVWRIVGDGKGGQVEHGQATEVVVSVNEQMKKETYLASGGR